MLNEKDENLCLILETRTITGQDAYQAIANNLQLDFLVENETVFLSSTLFAIEIITGEKSKIVFTFTSKETNDEHRYVETYLNYFIGDYRTFYLLVRCLCNILPESKTNPKKVKLSSNGIYCSCIETGDYCSVEDNCNLFVHADCEIINEDGLFLAVVGDMTGKNISGCISDEFITVKTLQYYQNKAYYSEDDLKIEGNRIIYKNKRNRIAEYMFYVKECSVKDVRNALKTIFTK